ncbi:MAG: mevalonate kinase [Thermoflexales bacterium]|nr:mevalonate kinase [Thermoflexales bacterium]MDW8350729.1 mevalonate kinase [Anaerolineae bacterium]
MIAMDKQAEAIEGSACAKVILCGEHAVVYGRPAIALPLPMLRARARIEPSHYAFTIFAPDVGAVVSAWRHTRRTRDPLARAALAALDLIGQKPPRATLIVTSDIPVGANLGSGAAVSVAIGRAIAAYFGYPLSAEEASQLAYEVEEIHHGSPSGIDNTVIAHERPVWFVRGRPPELLDSAIGDTLPLVIADTGITTPTRIPVGDVRAAWEREPERMERCFDAIAALVRSSREALERGDLEGLGRAMDANHALLQQLDVSCPELDALCAAARAAGALGAKMSGGGRGGNMIALARDAAHAVALCAALREAGAKRVICRARTVTTGDQPLPDLQI